MTVAFLWIKVTDIEHTKFLINKFYLPFIDHNQIKDYMRNLIRMNDVFKKIKSEFKFCKKTKYFEIYFRKKII